MSYKLTQQNVIFKNGNIINAIVRKNLKITCQIFFDSYDFFLFLIQFSLSKIHTLQSMKTLSKTSAFLIIFLMLIITASAQRFNGTYTLEFRHTVDKTAGMECASCFITINGDYLETGFDFSARPINDDGTMGEFLSQYIGAGNTNLNGESFSIRGKVKYNIFDEGNPAEHLDYWFQMDGSISESDYLSTITGNMRIVSSEADLDKFNGSDKWTFSFSGVNSEKRVSDADIVKGSFGSISGQVEVQLPGETEWRDASQSIELKPGTIIRTSDESTCILSFHDMSTVAMKPNSMIEIIHMEEDNSKIKLVLGKLWTNVKKMTRDGKMEISTNQIVAGIKGTTLVVGYVDGISTLEVIEGVVAFKSLLSGQEFDVNAGESALSDSTGIIYKSVIDIEQTKAEWASLTDTIHSGNSFLNNKALIYILAGVLAAGLLLIVILVISSKNRKKKMHNLGQVPTPPAVTPFSASTYQPPKPPLPMQKITTKFCSNCGNQLKPDAKFCGVCGMKLI